MVQEEHVWSGSPSQVLNFSTFLICGLASLTIVLAIVAIPYAIWRWLAVKNIKYELTSQRLKVHTGVLSKKVDELELYRVKDSSFEQSFFRRLFGVGDVLLMSSDSTSPSTTINAIKNARALREQIRGIVETRRDQKRVRVTELE